MRMPKNVTGRDHKKNRDDHAHSRCQCRVHARGCFHSLHIEQGEHQREKDSPRPVRHSGSKHVRLLAAPDGTDDGVEHVIHDHAPSRNVAECRIDLLADVGERRTGAGVGSRHAPIADGREQHGHHGNQDGGHDMSVPTVAEHAEHRHGRDGLDDDDAVEN